jgi:F-type H+-transporting ATPase subunit b
MNPRPPMRGPAPAVAAVMVLGVGAAFLALSMLDLARVRAVPAVAAEEDHSTPTSSALSREGEREEREHQGGEHATDDHAPQHAPRIDLKKLGLQVLNFAVLLFILIKFGGGAINKALAARHQQLKADLATAAELRMAAEARLAKQELRLASLETEIAEMRRDLKVEATSEKERLIAAAEERARRIKAETSFLVEQQVREAEVRLRRESAQSALQIAEDILRRSIGVSDQQRLLDTFVGDVEQAAPSAPKRSV